MKKPPPGTPESHPSSDNTNADKQEQGTLAGKILQVFRIGGDDERSVGRRGQPAAVPAEKLRGPVQMQVITDQNGPVLARSIADSAPVAASTPALPDATLRQPEARPALAAPAVSAEPIRLQTFSIDLTERLARTRAAQQEVLREMDKLDETGADLGKAIDRKR